MPTVATVIACGGIGRRFGGDKSQQLLAGKTLLARSIDLARRYNGPTALAGRTELMPDEGIPVLVDEQQGIGPISALSSGFAFAAQNGCTHVLLLACDQPFLPEDLAPRLIAAIGNAGVAMPVSGGHDQNMAALWRSDVAQLRDYIAGGGRSLWKFGEDVGIRRVEWDVAGPDPFTDIDDRSQLAEAEDRLKRG